MLATSCVAQIAVRRRAPAHARDQAIGLVLLAVGLVALVLAFPASSLVLLILVAGLLSGTGHGLAFLAAQAQLNLAAPPDRRGAVNAAFYTLIYLGVATVGDVDRPAHARRIALNRGDVIRRRDRAHRARDRRLARQTGSGRSSSSPCAAAMTVRATPSHE